MEYSGSLSIPRTSLGENFIETARLRCGISLLPLKRKNYCSIEKLEMSINLRESLTSSMRKEE